MLNLKDNTNSMTKQSTPQSYPRIELDKDRFNGFLDESRLVPHRYKIPKAELQDIITKAIANANKKSSRVILDVPENATEEEKKAIYEREGKELFNYFKKYYGDPASTAYECLGKHYLDIATEQFRNRTLQKERMNSGWRYQYMVKDCASKSKRFLDVSDIGAAEADFISTIEIKDQDNVLNIYVSVKNRVNTMGGQDWPKAIYALEEIAKHDKNRNGPYLCVFGIAMDKGLRIIKGSQTSNTPYSINTEIWLSDFFWPFFSNYSYKEIITSVLEVLIEKSNPKSNVSAELPIPDQLIKSFGAACSKFGLLDKGGKFNDSHKLVDLFCKSNKS